MEDSVTVSGAQFSAGAGAKKAKSVAGWQHIENRIENDFVHRLRSRMATSR